MQRHSPLFRFGLAFVLCAAGCSGLDALSETALGDAERRWRSNAPDSYRIVIEVSGQRVESGRFEVFVENGEVTRMTLDGEEISPDRSDDYSIEGLFGILRQELTLARDPRQLGAPEGYAAYLLARFDPQSGQLEHYRRTVGGASNNVDIEIVEFESEPAADQSRP